jgi:UDP-N-acetylmuramoyl-tripeptide--D-alanyl-D-alanine ligase
MAELGEQERAGHEQVGRLAAELGVDRLVAVAENARPILDGARGVAGWTGEAVFAADQAAAIEIVKGDLHADDVVLVKGSRYRTWDVVDALRPGARGEPSGPGSRGLSRLSSSKEVRP